MNPMKHFILVLAVFCSVTSSFATGFSRLVPGQKRTFITNINLGNLAPGKLSGHYRVIITWAIHNPPAATRRDVVSHSEESNFDTVNSVLSYRFDPTKDKPWIEGHLQLWSMSDSGRLNDLIAEKDCGQYSSQMSSSPEEVPGLSKSAVAKNIGCGVSAAEYIDARGKRLMFTFESFVATYFDMDEKLNVRGIYADKPDGLQGKLTVVEGDYHHSQNYYANVMTTAGRPEFVECNRAGEIVNLGLLPGGTTQKEYCYPLGFGKFRRVIYPVGDSAVPDYASRVLAAVTTHLGEPIGGISRHPKLNVSNSRSYNCHGYAMLASASARELEIPGDMNWIEGGYFGDTYKGALDEQPRSVYKSSGGAGDTYPFQTILQKHFRKVFEFYPSTYDQDESSRRAMSDSRLREGDLVTMIGGGEFLHSGILIRVAGQSELWVQSKLNEGPIVDVPLHQLILAYVPDRVEVHRKK